MKNIVSRNFLMYAGLPFVLLLGGCLGSGLFGGSSTTKEPPPPIGVYKTSDRGDTWATANSVLTTDTEQKPSLDNTSVSLLVMDPTDRQTIYLGSTSQGLFYTYDSAKRWWHSGPVRSGSVNAVAVTNDSTKRCILYLATSNKILKTTDCGRFWDQVYFDTRPKVIVSSLLVHKDSASTIYAGTSNGEVLKSLDSGVSWETVARLDKSVNELVQNTLNPEIIYAVVEGKGVWKTIDGGTNWQDKNDDLKQFKGATTITGITFDPKRPDTIILSSKFGLVRTTDGGQTWAAIKLLTPNGKVPIYSVVVNPENSAEIYYTTDTTLNRSTDAGVNWESRSLPVSGEKTKLLIDPKLTSTIYMGILKVNKENTGSSFIGF